jgi:lipopolysaccharide transport system ATP-binding protein
LPMSSESGSGGALAIRARGLGKRYTLGEHSGARFHYRTLVGSISEAVRSSFRRMHRGPETPHRDEASRYVWALRDVSFEIERGEVVGIIGLNGAGKTTLLKTLSRITEPTEGSAEVHGRVASLLEVGTGMHAELTGRENVYLAGAVLGMKKAETDRKFDEIVAFAELERFIDTPLKRYSSGMYVRLAFSVAAHLDPEILLVDEVLAVGDAAFQKRCLGKMEATVHQGRTVVLVSHDMGVISTLCKTAMTLRGGRIEFYGDARDAVNAYLACLGEEAVSNREWRFEEAPGDEGVRVRSVSVTDGRGAEKTHFSVTEPVVVTVEYWVLGDDTPMNITLQILDERDTMICRVGNYRATSSDPIKRKGLYRSRCVIPKNFLNGGKHTLTVNVLSNFRDERVLLPHCLGFKTVDDDRFYPLDGGWPGIVKPDFAWSDERIGSASTEPRGS